MSTLICVQVWIGTKQKELEAGSMQLMHQYTPWATGLLSILVPIFEPVGFVDAHPGTILGFNYTFISTTAILGSAVRSLPMRVRHMRVAWQFPVLGVTPCELLCFPKQLQTEI